MDVLANYSRERLVPYRKTNAAWLGDNGKGDGAFSVEMLAVRTTAAGMDCRKEER